MLRELARFGQSPWLDTIDRRLLRDGVLAKLIAEDGIKGLTSNPTIFQKAICASGDYDDDIKRLASEGKSALEIYETLAVADIQAAADLLAGVHESTDGVDGWVSLEVRPELAKDATSTIDEARRLFGLVGRPNLMIKVPGTAEGRRAVGTLIGEGRPINVTLVFSPAHYLGVAHAYAEGLLRFADSGGDMSKVASVASLFVSRVDTLVDARLDQVAAAATPAEAAQAKALKGTIAVAGAKSIYRKFKHETEGEPMSLLVKKGARVQRPLWASTSTKNPAYPDTLYVDALIGPHTVNTLPLATIHAFLDHGTVAETVESDLELSQSRLERLAELGISYDRACDELQEEGIRLFAQSFDELIDSIETKRTGLTCNSAT